jgi:thiol-disulfide isomerase/thioredoxin
VNKPHLYTLVVTALLTLPALLGCEDNKPATQEQPEGRFAAVSKKSQRAGAAQRSFCEATYPKDGAAAKPYASPAGRALPGPSKAAKPGKMWKWVNLWATWCKPCIEELPLLDKWQSTLAKDGVDLDVELWSVDEDEEALKNWLAKKPMPGAVKWIKDQESLGPALESFGIDKNSAIPVHILVDASEHIRCVRVGAVHEEDYGAIKTILVGG